jgi:uncharacterized lipoprotein NlpE involved in copper resistance
MKNKLIITAMAIVAIVVLSLAVIGCGEEEEEPVSKTYTITLKDGNLVFVVEYKALPSEEPAYLAYLKTRLGIIANSSFDDEIDAVSYLMSKGSQFTIDVEYTGDSYSGIKWDASTGSFKVHNAWISTASGTDLSASGIINAFNSVGY